MDSKNKAQQSQAALNTIADGINQIAKGVRQLALVAGHYEEPPQPQKLKPPEKPMVPDTTQGLPDNERRLKMMLISEVCQLTGLCRASLYQKMRDNNFPQSYKLGPRRVAWRRGEVEDWLSSKGTKR